MKFHLHKKFRHHRSTLRTIFLIGGSIALACIAIVLVWLSFLKLPDFKAFDERKVANSTRIYDSTGEVILYDTNRDIRRTEIPFEEMGDTIKHATIAIEDQKFYEHHGVRISSFIRAMWVNLVSGSFSQGGSTITQQVIKNSLLNKDKKITRKIKEWVLATKLERVMTKDEILAIYLNDNPYGGTIYGVEEAARSFFGKEPIDLSVAEAAYIAAIPQAPTYYSPYGSHRDALDNRKNIVLSEMKEMGFITDEAYEAAKAEVVTFLPLSNSSIKAPHFVFYIESYLEEKYGKEAIEEGGYSVVTTLDWELQQKAEEIVKRRALENESSWDASNQALVAIDPKTGQILTMVGSRDYFDKNIDGAYNIATAKRQPGSSFKPYVYATAFTQGYTPDTVLFDVSTEFAANCSPTGVGNNCYHPDNYDGKYLGPINLRNALAQSRNIPAVKLLYLAGVKNSIKTARDMGITTLSDTADYGLTLVLGGGEVTLLDMVSGYSTFANEGIHNPPTGILSVTDRDGNVIESYTPHPEVALDRNVALTISDVLSDNVARTPLFGANSFLSFGNTDVAGKTGTTNSNRDAWLIGYTPSIAVGVWSGNNDNSPMKKGSAISGPAWREYMDLAIKKYGTTPFPDPVYAYKTDYTIKPILRGVWLGNETYLIDSVSGKLATEYTPKATTIEKVIPNVHDILYWVNKSNPNGPVPSHPEDDSQYKNWEWSVQEWWSKNQGAYASMTGTDIPTDYDDIHDAGDVPEIKDVHISPTQYDPGESVTVSVDVDSNHPMASVSFYLNGTYIGEKTSAPWIYSFVPSDIDGVDDNAILTIRARDTFYNESETTLDLSS